MRKGRITFRTVVRDCLFLNWALPARAVEKPPEPLRLEEHLWRGEPYLFASALLFRHERLQVAGVPVFRLSYPQLHLRLYARDGEGIPSVLIRCVMVPPWVAPSARLVARQPVVAGAFRYPPVGAGIGEGSRSWQARRRSSGDRASLTVTGHPASPEVGLGPSLGSWERTTSYFRRRLRGYVETAGKLRQVTVSHRGVDIVPMRVETRDEGLLAECLPLLGDDGWPPLHSAWLCPEIPFVFELGEAPDPGSLVRSAAPVAADPATFASRELLVADPRSHRSAA